MELAAWMQLHLVNNFLDRVLPVLLHSSPVFSIDCRRSSQLMAVHPALLHSISLDVQLHNCTCYLAITSHS